jgi:type IV pilus biogenesis protein CpaD/CtpE
MREDRGVAVRSLPATIVLAACAVLALAGCADDEPTPAGPVTCSTGEPTAGRPTAPGMLLCVGTAGHVPLTDRNDRHHVVR